MPKKKRGSKNWGSDSFSLGVVQNRDQTLGGIGLVFQIVLNHLKYQIPPPSTQVSFQLQENDVQFPIDLSWFWHCSSFIDSCSFENHFWGKLRLFPIPAGWPMSCFSASDATTAGPVKPGHWLLRGRPSAETAKVGNAAGDNSDGTYLLPRKWKRNRDKTVLTFFYLSTIVLFNVIVSMLEYSIYITLRKKQMQGPQGDRPFCDCPTRFKMLQKKVDESSQPFVYNI